MWKNGDIQANIGLFYYWDITDEVFCNVMPIHTSYILLGQPSQNNKCAIHNDLRNCYSFR